MVYITGDVHGDIRRFGAPARRLKKGDTLIVCGDFGMLDVYKRQLSGLATGASWLFYYRALQLGDASLVAPVDKSSLVITILLAFIFLHEAISWKVILGSALIAAGTFVLIL